MGEGAERRIRALSVPRSEQQQNGVTYAGQILEHIVIPTAMNAPALFDQENFALRIASNLIDASMRNPIDFNDELCITTCQVREVRADRKLPDKLETTEAAGAQGLPKQALGLRVFLRRSRARVREVWERFAMI